ncbi:protein kinase [Sorangium cellulosum]|uniref:non-specific serine/threonine protein kinase n=1 Tax=Sorangium cellulosum TaxID=56 RepID=A0A2L0F6P4_SORCE|nr:protein kinase [Sorangium cellulosum]AUX47202.1 protein kinase [Sorangium cellulosum]
MPRCPVCHRRVTGTTPCPRDAWLPSPSRTFDAAHAALEPAPPSLPGLTLVRPVGAGGFATVWEAARAEGGDAVALKVARWTSPLTTERFRRDAEALAHVGPPHVPRLHESGTLGDGRPYIAMELVRGRTLAEELAELEEPPSAADVVATSEAILEALAAAHAKSVIHRDLKPENLLITEGERRVVLLDFGLTKHARAPEEEGITPRGTVAGTPEYMAPEQLRGDPVQDERTDIYAFGVILYELMTLRLPFSGDRSAVEHGHLALRPPRPHEFAAVPEELERLALACLAKEPERRPPDVDALRRALRRALARSCPSDAPPTPPASPPRGALLTEGRQPAIVLVAEAKSASAAVMSAVVARKGFVARQRGTRLVCVFSGVDADDPVSAAIAVAREVEERYAGRAALHLAGLIVRRKGQGPPAVYGAPVEQPDAWMPPDGWGGVVLTVDLVRALPQGELRGATRDPALSRSAGRAFYRLAAAPPALSDPSRAARGAPLVGRGEVLGALAVSMDASMSGACPGLFTLIGEGGLGKSRLADEAAALVRRMQGRAQLIALRAAQPLAGERASIELLARVLDATPGAPPEDPRAFCAARLGEELAEETWRAVAAALGWTPAEEIPASPWSLRQSTMRAIAGGLRRRAREAPVAVILDDAHWADDAALDALEYATLDAPGCALWVLVAAHPRFEEMRRGWGARAERHDRAVLGRLSEQDTMRLAAELLRPAEYPPEAALRQLAGWAGHNPSSLAELVRALKRAGAVQQHPTGAFYVATAALDQLPTLPVWQWLAARRLDALSPELAACVRLCSVLGPDVTREEVEEIQDAIEQAGGASTPIDAGVGLSALASIGLLVRSERGIYAFENATFRDAVYDGLAPAQRQTIHAHAFAWWRARVDPLAPDRRGLVHLARHAAACGERAQAAAAHLALGDRATASHDNVEADQRYTAALALLDAGDARPRALALAGRAKARYSLHRISEALADLELARGLAGELGDDRLAAELLLEEATALDHATDFAGSARRADDARAIIERLGDPRLEDRLLMALGRSRWRQQQVAEAIGLLDRASAGAAAGGDRETRVIALLLLSIALVISGRLSDAEARFCEVIALSKEMNDRLHLCSAYANRAYLWAALSAPERGLEDLSRAVELAREIGNPGPEHVATHNLAELLHWCGRADEALALARRSRVLEERFGGRDAPDDALLLARVQAARGDLGEAGRLVAWIDARCRPDPSSPAVYALFRTMKLVLAAAGIRSAAAVGAEEDSWEALTELAERTLPVEELLEVLYFRARVAASAGRHAEARAALDRARPALAGCRMWQPRFGAVAALLPSPNEPAGGAHPCAPGEPE